MLRLGTVEILALLAIVILIFGVGRISKLGGELGQGLRLFKKSLFAKEENEDREPQSSTNSTPEK